MENGASLMMKNKCEVLQEEDWGFEATAQLVVGFQGLKFKNEEDDTSSWVNLNFQYYDHTRDNLSIGQIQLDHYYHYYDMHLDRALV